LQKKKKKPAIKKKAHPNGKTKVTAIKDFVRNYPVVAREKHKLSDSKPKIGKQRSKRFQGILKREGQSERSRNGKKKVSRRSI